jgi:hypothetical protein
MAVHALIDAAVVSTLRGAVSPDAGLVDELARHRARPTGGAGDGGTGVDEALTAVLVAEVTDAWQRGWQPADLHRAVERHRRRSPAGRGRGPGRLLVRAAAVEAARHPEATVPNRWRQQLDALGADAGPAGGGASGAGGAATSWAVPGRPPQAGPPGPARVEAVAVAITTLAVLRTLPRLPKLGPAPGEGPAPVATGGRADAATLHKVTSLLAKAESTTYPDEAEALTAKAQQLMTRYAIDRAQLDAGRGDEPVAGGRRLAVDDPYANPRFLLLSAVADANRCRSVWTRQWGFATVFGDEGDLDAVEMLYTSLLVQATRAMVVQPRPARRTGAGTRSFRHAFLVAFAGRIGERLVEAAEAVTVDAARSSSALVPLFRAREAAADRAVADAFPRTRPLRVSARNAEGWEAGTQAADRADLGRPGVRTRSPRPLR